MSKLETKMLYCPRCQGRGCAQCRNAGIFLQAPAKIFYWQPAREDHYLATQRIQFSCNNFLDYLAIFFGVSALLYQSVIFLVDGLRLSPLLWLGALALAFVFFRMERKEERQKKLMYQEIGKGERGGENIDAIMAAHHLLEDAEPYLNHGARLALTQAWHQGGETLEPLHLFRVLLGHRAVERVLLRLGLSPTSILKKWQKLVKDYVPRRDGAFQVVTKEAILEALAYALVLHSETVGPVELFLALTKVETQLLAIFEDDDCDLRSLVLTAQWLQRQKHFQQQWKRFATRARFKPRGVMNRAYTSRATPTLDRVSADLTVQAKAGALPLLVGREKEMEEILVNLSQKDGNVILLGEPGVGKTALAYGLANLMAAEDVPEVLQDNRIVELDLGAIGTGVQPVALLKKAISEVIQSGNIILYLENIANLVGLGAIQAGVDAAAVLMQVLPLRTVHVIGTANPQDYARILENKGEFLRRFQVVRVEEPAPELALAILESAVGLIEYEEGVFFTLPALDAAVSLSQRYLNDQYLPVKALNLLKDAASFARKGGKLRVVRREDIAQLIERELKIPVTEISEEEGQKLLNLEQLLHQKIIDQEEGVRMVAEAMRRARAGMRSQERPIVSLLFVGPTGVGKTETAKALAEIYFGSPEAMLRLDLTEYTTPPDLWKLIGAPPTAGGEASGGYFTEAVRQKPFSLILLDEIEKAHRDVQQAFLQVVEDGRLTDAKGRRINFTNTIIIATSNAGTPEITAAITAGKDLADYKNVFMEQVLTRDFALEFLNRFDGIVLFRPLAPQHVQAIARLMLEKTKQRLATQKRNFAYTEEAVKELAQKGFDPVFGARPLRRVIQDTVDNALAKQILSGELGRRDVAVLEAGGKITVRQAEEI